MYYPLTPMFCKPKNDAEKRFWITMFRQTFGVTPIRFKQNEIRLEKRCKEYSVEYVAPQHTDSVEAIHERKSLLQKKCKAATDKIRRSHPSDQEKERARKRSRNRKGKATNDMNSSEVRHFRITGPGGAPNYSYLPVTSHSFSCVMNEEECSTARRYLGQLAPCYLEQLTLGEQEQVEFEKPLNFWSCYEKVRVKKRKKVYMDGWRVVMCNTKDVLSAEIYINDNCTKIGASVGCLPSAGFFRQLEDSRRVMLGNEGNYRDALVMHHFCFEGEDSKQISVEVVADIPAGRGDIIQEAKRIAEAKEDIKYWNGLELYEYLNDQGITQVRFENVSFDVSIVRAGSTAHQITRREIQELDYKAGRTHEKPPALPPPPPEDLSEAKSNVYHPLTPVFCIPRDSVEESEWKERFLQSFHVTPARFRLNEKKLTEGCKKYSIRYIAPQLEDSADETISRKYALHKKIQACRNRERQEERQLEKLCLEEGVTYIPPPPNETRRQQENRRRNLNEKYWEEVRKRHEEERRQGEEERRQADERRAEEERKRWATMSPEEKAQEKFLVKFEEEYKKREKEKMERLANMSPEEKAQAKQKSIEERRKKVELERRWPLMSPEEKAEANQKTAEEEREYREFLRRVKEQEGYDKLKREVLWNKKEYYRKRGMHEEANAAWNQAPPVHTVNGYKPLRDPLFYQAYHCPH